MNITKHKKITEYKAVIFDLDGTLYFQTKLRLIMACCLGGYYVSHFWKFKELLALKKFREVRERWDDISSTDESVRGVADGEESVSVDKAVPVGTDETLALNAEAAACDESSRLSLDEAQYCYVSRKMHMSAEHVCAVVEEWMYEKPLSTLMECRDEALVDFINILREQGISVMIYSDYPVADKLRALDIPADKTYSALDEDIMSLKPDPKGLLKILSDNQFQPSDIIMIGDRMSKDGQAAINTGVDYIILEKSATAREKLYAELLKEI